jgi:dolichol-phosphate mannosyltransferase
MPNPLPGVSVVVPVRNEADNIRPLVSEIVRAMEGHFDYEILYVNDGSTDGTAAALAACRKDFPALRVFSHKTSCGQSAATLTAVRRARKDWIAVLDGDGQNDPADIHKLWAWLQTRDEPALAMGYRVQRQDAENRKSASRFANGLRNLVLKDGCPDSGCGLKMLPRSLFLELPPFDHMHRFMPALVQRAGGAVASIPVSHRPRGAGVSNYTNWKRALVGIVDLAGLRWLQARGKRPVVSEE